MIPDSALGLLFFIVLLSPGLAYVLRSERSVPAPDLSVFRESLRVLFASIVCLSITVACAAIVCWRVPKIRPDLQAFLVDPSAYAAAHFTRTVWWIVIVVTIATVLGYGAADPRWLDLREKLRGSKVVEALLGSAPISDVTAWHKSMKTYKDGPEIYVSARMDDGTVVSGYVVSYSTHAIEDSDRDLLLTQAELLIPGAQPVSIDSTYTIISARNIRRLDVTRIVADEAGATADVPSQRAETATG